MCAHQFLLSPLVGTEAIALFPIPSQYSDKIYMYISVLPIHDLMQSNTFELHVSKHRSNPRTMNSQTNGEYKRQQYCM